METKVNPFNELATLQYSDRHKVGETLDRILLQFEKEVAEQKQLTQNKGQ